MAYMGNLILPINSSADIRQCCLVGNIMVHFDYINLSYFEIFDPYRMAVEGMNQICSKLADSLIGFRNCKGLVFWLEKEYGLILFLRHLLVKGFEDFIANYLCCKFVQSMQDVAPLEHRIHYLSSSWPKGTQHQCHYRSSRFSV